MSIEPTEDVTPASVMAEILDSLREDVSGRFSSPSTEAALASLWPDVAIIPLEALKTLRKWWVGEDSGPEEVWGILEDLLASAQTAEEERAR